MRSECRCNKNPCDAGEEKVSCCFAGCIKAEGTNYGSDKKQEDVDKSGVKVDQTEKQEGPEEVEKKLGEVDSEKVKVLPTTTINVNEPGSDAHKSIMGDTKEAPNDKRRSP